MKKIKTSSLRVIGLLILIFSFNKVHSKTFPVTDNFTSSPIGTYIETYIDYSESLELQDILNNPNLAFEQQVHQQVIGGSRKDAFYWIKLPVFNNSDSLINLVLHTNDIRITYIRGYETQNGELLNNYSAGLAEKFSDRVLPHRSAAFPFSLESKTKKTLYIQIHNRLDPIQFPISLSSHKNFVSTAQKEYFLLGIFHGVLIFLVLIAVFLIAVLKQRLFFYYFLYIVFILMTSLSLSGLGYQFLYPNDTVIAAHSQMLWGLLAIYSVYLFVIEYYKNENKDVRFAQKTLKYITPIVIFLTPFLIFPDYLDIHSNLFLKKLIFLPAIFLMFICYFILQTLVKISWKNPSWNNLVFLLGYSSIAIYGIISFPINFGLIPTTIDKINFFRVALIIEVFCITILIAHRIWTIRLDNIKLDSEIQLAKLEKEQSDKIKALEESKTRFYANITHEFRTPLTIIKGLANEINGDENQKKIIVRNSDILLKLVNQILDLSKSDSEGIKLNYIQGDIITYLTYLNETFNKWCISKDIQFTFKCELDHLDMDYDPQRLQEVLTNLISNSIKFTGKGGEISIESSTDKEYKILKIKDTGVGIKKEELPFIFDRFYQAENTDTINSAGTGIGLSHSKELISLMGGDINVESTIGLGTTFTIKLPITRFANKSDFSENRLIEEGNVINNLNASTDNLNSTTDSIENNTILVIEDNKDVQGYISLCLKEYYNLLFANDGEEGIQTAFAESPDLIVCDIMMPLKNGYEVCSRLKSDIITSHIPFIMLTAKATQTNKLKGLELGADAYIYKPFDKTELLLTINNLIVQRERLQNALNSSVLKPIESKFDKEKLFLNDVNAIIRNNHSNEQFGVEMLTHKLFMSRSQLYRKIKALTNKSIAAYIRTIRLQDGMLQLKTTDKSVTEIAYSVGFKNLTYFSSSFSQEFGCSPNSISRN